MSDLVLDLRAGRLALACTPLNTARLVPLMRLAERAAAAAAAGFVDLDATVAADDAVAAGGVGAVRGGGGNGGDGGVGRRGQGAGACWRGRLRSVSLDVLVLNRAPRDEEWAYLEAWAAAQVPAAAEAALAAGWRTGRGGGGRGGGGGGAGLEAACGAEPGGLAVGCVVATYPECGGGAAAEGAATATAVAAAAEGGARGEPPPPPLLPPGPLQRVLRLCARGSVRRLVLRVPWEVEPAGQTEDEARAGLQRRAGLGRGSAAGGGGAGLGGAGALAVAGRGKVEALVRAAVAELSALAKEGWTLPDELTVELILLRADDVSDEDFEDAEGTAREEALHLVERELERAGVAGTIAVTVDWLSIDTIVKWCSSQGGR